MAARNKRINVSVTPQDLERIKVVAEKNYRTPADFCRAAALEKVEEMERKDG